MLQRYVTFHWQDVILFKLDQLDEIFNIILFSVIFVKVNEMRNLKSKYLFVLPNKH